MLNLKAIKFRFFLSLITFFGLFFSFSCRKDTPTGPGSYVSLALYKDDNFPLQEELVEPSVFGLKIVQIDLFSGSDSGQKIWQNLDCTASNEICSFASITQFLDLATTTAEVNVGFGNQTHFVKPGTYSSAKITICGENEDKPFKWVMSQLGIDETFSIGSCSINAAASAPITIPDGGRVKLLLNYSTQEIATIDADEISGQHCVTRDSKTHCIKIPTFSISLDE